jgi:hypothetical protein
VKVKDFINTLNTVSFSSLTNQILWMLGSAVFTCVAAWLMTRPDQFNASGVLIASGSGMRAVGVDLAMALLFAWTGKSAITAASRFGKSTTSEKYVEAKERGKATAPPQTVVEAKDQSTVKVDASPASGPEREPRGKDEDRQWASGDPRAGVL